MSHLYSYRHLEGDHFKGIKGIIDENSNNSMLFTNFSLRPNEEWGHIVNFLVFFEREEERKYREMEGKIKSCILSEKGKDSTLLIEAPSEQIEAPPEFVKPLHDFFNKHFIWYTGEYELKIQLITNIGRTNIEQTYRFTIFEYYEEELREIIEGYKYGDGIYWDSGKAPQNILLDIKEL